VHLGSAHSTARLLGQAAQPPWAFRPMSNETEEGKIPLVSGGSPTKSGRPAAVGRWESGLGVTPVDGDPDLGRRAAGGSLWRAGGGDGCRWRGAPVGGGGVGRLSLARLVRSVSTSEIGRRYWRGRWGQRSTGDGGRWEGGLGNEGGGRLGATIVLAEGSGVEVHEGGVQWPALGAWSGGGQ
jgi:hypothetical protein